MTCIIGVEYSGKVYIGADSCSYGSYMNRSSSTSKVFVRDGLVIGCAGSVRMGQILKYSLEVPKFDGPTTAERYMATKFVLAVRKSFSEHGFMWKENERETGGSFLVGVMGELYHVDSDYQASRVVYGYDCIGSGAEVAMGAMYALTRVDEPKDSPLNIIGIALMASAEFSPNVSGPFTVLYT